MAWFVGTAPQCSLPVQGARTTWEAYDAHGVPVALASGCFDGDAPSRVPLFRQHRQQGTRGKDAPE